MSTHAKIVCVGIAASVFACFELSRDGGWSAIAFWGVVLVIGACAHSELGD